MFDRANDGVTSVGGDNNLYNYLFIKEESDSILASASGLSAKEEVGLLRAFGRFEKVFPLQLPLTKGHMAHLIIGP